MKLLRNFSLQSKMIIFIVALVIFQIGAMGFVSTKLVDTILEDQIIHPAQDVVQTDERMPKSINPLTLEKVEEEVKKLDANGVNAEVLGMQVGISRTTARRYLEFLVSKGAVKPSLVYGSVGRPERLYFQVSNKS